MAAGNGHVVLLTSRWAATASGVQAQGTHPRRRRGGQLGRVGTRIGPRAHSRTLLAPAAVRMPRGAVSRRRVAGGSCLCLTDLDKVVAFSRTTLVSSAVPDDSMAVFIPRRPVSIRQGITGSRTANTTP